VSDWLPIPPDLQQAPELAALAILDAAAETTRVVLLYRFALDRDARQPSTDARGPGRRARKREAEQAGKAAGKTARGAA